MVPPDPIREFKGGDGSKGTGGSKGAAEAGVAPTSIQPESRNCKLGLARSQAMVIKTVSSTLHMLNQINMLRQGYPHPYQAKVNALFLHWRLFDRIKPGQIEAKEVP
jgi:hypothetical protein